MSFVRRFIDATFQLGEGDFGLSGFNTVKLTGLRISAHVEGAGGRSMINANARIWGMNLSQMNQLSTLGQKFTSIRKNVLTLEARDGENGTPSTFFKGTIFDCWADLNSQPDVAFVVQAQSGLFDAVTPTNPISIAGSADVASMLSGIATQMGYPFENGGVTTKLPKAYYGGSLRDQALKIVKDAGIQWNSTENGILAIWPTGGSRGGLIPVLSTESGMVGYPTFTANGILLKTLFNPNIRFGGRVEVKSSLQSILSRGENPSNPSAATGQWIVNKVDHQLESIVPRGQWFSTIYAISSGTFTHK